MKIAILTLPLHTNYGGILQAYALQTVLQRMGHEVIVIDYDPYCAPLSNWKKPLSYTKRFFEKYFFKKIPSIFLEEYYNNITITKRKNTKVFIDKYIKTLPIKNINSLDGSLFDAIIVGSDQVWRPFYFSYYFNIENAYLSFATNWNIKRIAYAASFGTDKWEYTEAQTKFCKQLVSLFDAVSVREDSGVILCEKFLGIKAEHVLDPTMLLDKNTYIKLIQTSDIQLSKGNLFSYVLDPKEEINLFISMLSKKEGLVHFDVNSRVKDEDAQLNETVQPPVEQWLRGFYDAEFVVTDSFHACVFAMIFNKPFVVFGNMNRGCARFNSLLKMFNQEFRLIENFDDYAKRKSLIMSKPNIDSMLIELRKISFNFFIRNLN